MNAFDLISMASKKQHDGLSFAPPFCQLFQVKCFPTNKNQRSRPALGLILPSWRHIGIRRVGIPTRVAYRCFPSDQQRASGWRRIIWSTHIVLLAACVVAIINISARPVSKNQAQRKETWKAHRKLRERRGDDGLRSVWLGGRAPRFRLGVGVEDRGGKNTA